MKPFGRLAEVNGYPLVENWYEGMKINTDAEERAALLLSWGAATKDRGKECGRCRGRGYTRKDVNIGCVVCRGRGVCDA